MFVLVTLLSLLALVSIDQITKIWAASDLAVNGPVSVIEGVFEFRYCENTGVAFSLLEDQRWLFIPLSILISAVMLLILYRSPLRRHFLFSCVCVLIAAGGIGNLIDRIVYGYVIDFLYFRLINFPIFNFADCCVSVGAVLLFVFFLFVYKEEESPLRTLLLGIPKKEKKGDGE